MENFIHEIPEREVNDEIWFPIIINKDNQLVNAMLAAFHTWKCGVKSWVNHFHFHPSNCDPHFDLGFDSQCTAVPFHFNIIKKSIKQASLQGPSGVQ